MKKSLLNAIVSRVGKSAACLVLGLAVVSQTARAASYATTALSFSPAAFWQLDETGNPSSGTLLAVDSSGNGLNGTYGTTSQNAFSGILGPQPPDYPGFTLNQGAVQTLNGDNSSPVLLPHLNLNTNAITIAMWIKPNNTSPTFTGLLMNRDSLGDAAGFGFGGNTTPSTGMAELGYTWNTNNNATYNFHSGLYPLINTWQFVALVVKTNSATIYQYYIDPNTGQTNLLSSVNAIAHTPEAFANGGIYLGSDVNQNSVGQPNNVFNGAIDGAVVYRAALTSDQILTLFAAGLGVQGFVPAISQQPQSAYVLAGTKAQFSASGINGTTPFTYQWQLNGTNVNVLADSANFTGANSNILTVLSATAADAGTYRLYVTNSIGTIVSSNALLTIQAPALVGQWLDGSAAGTNLLDVSGYSLAANHGAYLIGGGLYVFTNDVPFGKTGQSLLLYNSDTGLAISNSSTLDANYDDTFDNRILNSFTVACWSKTLPTTWSPWVSKFGEAEAGWQLRRAGGTSFSCFTVRNNGAGGSSNSVTAGTTSLGGLDDLSATTFAVGDGNWHFFVGTFNAATGVRSLYVDANLVANESSSNTPYVLAPAEHLCIGAKDSPPGNTFGNYSTNQIFDVRVYNYSLTASDIQGLYGQVPAVINGQPQPVTGFVGSPAQIVAVVGGTLPITYQWTLNGTNVDLLADAANFNGAHSNILTILSAAAGDAGNYRLFVTNNFGHDASSNAALTLVPKLLVGKWFTGADTLADLSGYQPAGIHDGMPVGPSGGGGGASYSFTNDVPPGKTGHSLVLTASDTAIAINNSSTSDASYTNTFDDTINSAMTVAFWARGWPGGWNPWVSKFGEANGWQLRNDGNNGVSPCWTIRGGGGTVTKGTAVYSNPDDMAATDLTYGDDGLWHAYVGIYNSVTGIRQLYVDGALAASSTGNVKYNLATAAHVVIGARDSGNGTYGNFFTGKIYDVRISNYDWNTNEIAGFSTIPDPSIGGQPPAAINAYVGLTAKITVGGISGTAPITNQWQLNGTNLVDGGFGGAIISGAHSNILTISQVTTNVQGTYHLIVSNPKNILTSSNTVLTVLATVPPPATNLVGAWLTGAANLVDSSGYSPAGTHDGYGITGTSTPSSNYAFTNDVPPGMSGNSLVLAGTTGIAISNSSTFDASYTNTYDDTMTNMTVAFWAKGRPGGWNPWVSKYGEGSGWQLRVNNGGTPTWTVRGNGATEDMSGGAVVDNNWHFYVGTYDGGTFSDKLYIDGTLTVQQVGIQPYTLSPAAHLAIGARDGGGNNFGNYFQGEIYGVRIYNTALTEAQLNNLIVPTVAPLPVFNGRPILNGNQFILSWSSGSLQQATNVLGPWSPTGATSPFTNIISPTTPRMFYRLSNP